MSGLARIEMTTGRLTTVIAVAQLVDMESMLARSRTGQACRDAERFSIRGQHDIPDLSAVIRREQARTSSVGERRRRGDREATRDPDQSHPHIDQTECLRSGFLPSIE
jgi:hypothetical protein